MLNMTPNEMPATNTSSAPTIEDGVYPAVISLIADLGVQKNKIYESRGKADDDCTPDDYDIGHQLWFSFSLPTERYTAEYEGEEVTRDPVLGKGFKVSKSDKSNLVKMYTAVVKDGRSFGEMLGMPVTVTTGTTSGGKPKVVSIAAAMRGTSVADPINDLVLVSEDDWDNVDDLAIPDFLKTMIKERV